MRKVEYEYDLGEYILITDVRVSKALESLIDYYMSIPKDIKLNLADYSTHHITCVELR